MRRFSRLLLDASTALSLLLCVGTLVLWGRSYFAADVLILRSAERLIVTFAYRGAVVGLAASERHSSSVPAVEYKRESPDNAQREEQSLMYGLEIVRHIPGARVTLWRFGPFVYAAQGGSAPEMRVVRFPLWAASLGLSGLPVLRRLAPRWRRRRQAATTGRCAQCGYDLRATPERCPECGAISAAT
jgi:hypothetical protein